MHYILNNFKVQTISWPNFQQFLPNVGHFRGILGPATQHLRPIASYQLVNGPRWQCTLKSKFMLTKYVSGSTFFFEESLFLPGNSYIRSTLYTKYSTLFFRYYSIAVYFTGFLENCVYILIISLIATTLFIIEQSSTTIDYDSKSHWLTVLSMVLMINRIIKLQFNLIPYLFIYNVSIIKKITIETI